ncbi:uncharacterized protein LOC119568355 [Penaeus monodon]|uniref:uncharacterized protein LOC119568355 n=1 Tax=Penaeus monodon TaxID=6687 RepID=UPI0018A6F06E|nr:uncharacterized protein LOC119568355 [Penaeus monodon]
MVYQCHLTKFVILRTPAILQSDNGSEFTAKVTSELKELWPQLIMVHSKPRHQQSQGSVERANGDIKDMLHAWMTDNKTQNWCVGLRLVQHQRNSAHHSGIKHTPFKALFDTDPRDDLLALFAALEKMKFLLKIPVSTSICNTCSSLSAYTCSRPPVQTSICSTSLHLSANREAQLSQVERMVKRNLIDIKAGEEGDNIAVLIPMFDICPQRFLILSDVNQEDLVSLRQALKKSTTGGQGFVKYDCAANTKCCNSRC